MLKRMFLVLLLVAAATSAHALKKAVWDYSQTDVTNPTDQANFFTFATANNIKTVYINAEALIQTPADTAALVDFVNTAGADGIGVEMLYGDNCWVYETPPTSGSCATTNPDYDGNQDYAVSLTTDTVAFLSNPDLKYMPIGVNYDVEPASLPDWKSSTNTIASDYITLINRLETAVAGSGITVTMDTSFSFDVTSVTFNGVTQDLNQFVISAADKTVLLDYRITASTIESGAATDLAYAVKAGKQVILGVDTCDDGSSDPNFYGQTLSEMLSVLRTVNSYEKINYPSSYGGLAIEDSTCYAAMP